jgi:hypothetical protein
MAKGSKTSTTQPRTWSQLHVKPPKYPAHRSTRVHQDQPRSAKNPRTIIPPPQSARIMQRYISGESLRKIAQEEHRDRATISKIVKGPEVHQYIEELRARFFGAMEIAMETLLEELKNPNSKTRGWLAFEALKASGVIPEKDQKVKLELPVQEPEPDSEQAAIKRIAAALVQGAIERHKSFGLPLPEADEVEQSLLAKAKTKKNGEKPE